MGKKNAPKKVETFAIRVRGLCGEEIDHTVDSTTTIAQMKHDLQESFQRGNVPEDHMFLWIRQQILDNTETMEDLHCKNGDQFNITWAHCGTDPRRRRPYPEEGYIPAERIPQWPGMNTDEAREKRRLEEEAAKAEAASA